MCDCDPVLPVQLLATCRTVFNEAMPVLYDQIEFKVVVLPLPDELCSSNTLKRLPIYGQAHIKNMMIHHRDKEWTYPAVDCYTSAHELRDVVRQASRQCTRLETARFHIETGYPQDIPYGFEEFVRIPSLRKIIVEIHGDKDHQDDDFFPFRMGLVSTITGKAAQVEREVEDVIEVSVSESCDSGSTCYHILLGEPGYIDLSKPYPVWC